MRTPYELVLEGPGKNALSSAMMRSIVARLDEAGDRPVLLRGANGALSAGLDLKEVGALRGDDMLAFLHLLERTMVALYLHPAPTVALVDGHAIAGGCVLALCCDHRVGLAGSRLRMGLNEVALGVRFPPRIFAIVSRRIPVAYRERVLLGAGRFDVEQALALGLLDELSPDAEALARTRLGELAAHPAGAYAATKRDLRGDEDGLCPSVAHDALLRAMVATWSADDVRARIAAVLAR